MPAGGRREGSGRKLGGANKKTRAIADAAVANGITPLEVLLTTMRAAWQRTEEGSLKGEDLNLAVSCAEKAATFIHPRMQTITHGGSLDTKVTGRLLVTWGGERPPEK